MKISLKISKKIDWQVMITPFINRFFKLTAIYRDYVSLFKSAVCKLINLFRYFISELKIFAHIYFVGWFENQVNNFFNKISSISNSLYFYFVKKYPVFKKLFRK